MRLALVLPALLLAGCSVWRPAPDSLPLAQQMEARRLDLSQWRFKGRVLSEEQRASLRWQQDGAQFDLLLRGPFGLGGLRISGTPQQVAITDGQQTWHSSAPAEDIYRRTGLLVPLEALAYWARGLPAPDQGEARLLRDAAGFIAQIEQAGWQVELGDYRAADDAPLWFPHHLRLSSGAQWFEIEVRRWTLL